MMKKTILILLTLLPLSLWAQDNTWEMPEEEQETEAEKKENPDRKYLRGAVPEVDGRILFTKTIESPGKTARQIYDIALAYMTRMTRERNQLSSRVAIADSTGCEIVGTYEEWLVFRSSAIVLDRTRLSYVLQAKCQDGKAQITISRLRYVYDVDRKPQRYTAEEWISDDNAVNKKNTRLLPLSAKFRRKTIDRKDFLFNKFESLLNS